MTAVPNVAENIRDAAWKRVVLSLDFHSVLSVPVAYDGIFYGVLSVYADRPTGFQELVDSALEQIGETAAYAISAAERQYCLRSDTVTELELRVEEPTDLLNVIAQGVGTTVEYLELSLLPEGSTKLQFSASDVSAESVLASTAGVFGVDSLTHVAGDDRNLFTAVVNRETVASVLAKGGGTPAEIIADGTILDVTVHVPQTIDARTFVTRLEGRYPDTTLLSRRDRARSEISRLDFLEELERELTDRQMEVLRTAYEDGFFQSPRESTGQDVANSLGVSQPTVSHHLREGQGTLFSLLFEVS